MSLFIKFLEPFTPFVDWIFHVALTPQIILLRLGSEAERSNPDSIYQVSKRLIALPYPWDLLLNDFTIFVFLFILDIVLLCNLYRCMRKEPDIEKPDAPIVPINYKDDTVLRQPVKKPELPPVPEEADPIPIGKRLPPRNRRFPSRFQTHKVLE